MEEYAIMVAENAAVWVTGPADSAIKNRMGEAMKTIPTLLLRRRPLPATELNVITAFVLLGPAPAGQVGRVIIATIAH